jgi:hypothetical protein
MLRILSLATVVAAAIALPAIAQDTKAPPAAPPAATSPQQQGDSISLTSQAAQAWIGKPVYSSDGQKLGEVAAFARGADDKITAMHADTGGFMGMGETRVRLSPAQFKLSGDRVVLELTAAQAKDLPKVAK